MLSTKKDDLELLWGAEEIGAAIGRTPRQAFHLLEAGHIPARKVGDRWVAERGKLMVAILGTGTSETAA